MRTQIFNALKITALAIALSFGISYVYAWTAPTVSPTGGNVLVPINTGGTAQTKTGGLSVATISGNVGIGTDTPANKLDVNGTSIFRNELTVNKTTSGTAVTVGGLSNDANTGTMWVNNLLFGTDSTDSHLFIQSHGNKPLYINELSNDTILNKNLGSVGIGTTALAQKLTVAGAIGATGDICTTTTGPSICLSTPAVATPHGTAGPGSWVAPTGVTKVFVTAVGGGGGGGGSTTWNGQCSGYGGGGGGAGAFAFKNLVTVTPGTTYTIVAGTAGTAGPAGTTNALGGTGGVSGISGVFTVAGGTGGNGPWSSGGCAGTAGTAGAGNSDSIYLGGIVAGSSGTPSDGTASGGKAGNSFASPNYGSGGAGALPNVSTSGTAGKPGFVLVEW